MERPAAALLAVQPQPSAHAVDQARRNTQPESGAAEFARRGSVGLLERLENLRLLRRGNADAGVLHRECSATSSAPPWVASSSATRTVTAPACVNFTALLMRFVNACVRRCESAINRSGTRASMSALTAKPFLRRAAPTPSPWRPGCRAARMRASRTSCGPLRSWRNPECR